MVLCAQYPFIEAIDIELIDFGTKPIRVGGVKVYGSFDDEVIMETPLTWGSNASVRASMRLRFNKWSFYIPVEIANFQVSAFENQHHKMIPFQGWWNLSQLRQSESKRALWARVPVGVQQGYQQREKV